MGIVKQIGLAILLLSLAVFITFFGRLPVFRRTPIGFLHRLIWIHIPNGLAAVDQHVTGGRLGSRMKRTGHYLLYEKHPIVLIFFLALLLTSELLFVPASLPLLPVTFSPSPFLLSLQHLLLPLLITPPYIFLHLSHRTLSTITPLNHPTTMLTYPYDRIIFHPSPTPFAPACRTCSLPKPARSKHCSICRSCIQKADHHCVWINNCVGRNNYLYFLGLMFSISALLAYGAWLGYRILYIQIGMLFPAPSSPSSPNRNWARGLTWGAYAGEFADIIAAHPFIAAPALLAGLSFPLAAGLSLYHVYLVWAGMTTNESGKWADLREDIAERRVWRSRVEGLRGDWPGLEEEEGDGKGERGGKWPVKAEGVVVTMEEAGKRPRARRRERKKKEKDGMVGSGQELGVEGGDGSTDVDGDGDVEVGLSEETVERWEEDERWTQVKSLGEIENIYDLGFWDNLRDVILNRE